MLDPASWLEQAKALPMGRSARVPHDCGGGVPMVVDHKETGWSAWCHRCSDKGWQPKPMPTLAERAEARAAQEAAERAMKHDPRPPQPCNFIVDSWPAQARLWLYKAGLFKTDIAELGAYYHERSGRVVLPVLDGGKLVYWQGRNVGLSGLDAPKYINPQVDRKELCPRYGSDNVVVLTEDILSAFRVGQVSEGWSLMGTKLHMPTLSALIATGKPVLVWLDADGPGRSAAHKVMRDLQNVGVRCADILTSKDPKLYSRAEILNLIRRTQETL